MKKKSFVAICIAVFMLISSMTIFTGCDFSFGDTAPKKYTIQYTDDDGTHQLTVTEGMPYSLDVIPSKNGYVFTGLYDAEVGGTQYISSSGSSLTPFSGTNNIVLFPQYKAKDYTVILDYQGAPVTGTRQVTVAYGSSLPELPKNLTWGHKEFVGWYTEAECGGKKIADEFGLLPLVSVLNEQNFDLSGISVTLYAGFEIEKHTVTLCFVDGVDNEVTEVPYNTPVSEIVSDTRVDGDAVLTWSKTQSGEIFNGRVTEDITLYAIEYAPVLDFDSNGGEEISHIIARANTEIDLPTPTKDLAEFSHWEDKDGKKFTSAKMPIKSTSLKAVWQAKLVFDENGGSEVKDISVTAGTKITLPTPEKEGFIFAGWYTAEKEKYTSTKMPSAGLKLKAGWYEKKEKNITLVDNNVDNKLIVDSNKLSVKKRLKIDLSDELSTIPSDGVDVNFEITFKWGNTYKYVKADGQIALYEGDEFSTDYELAKKTLSHNDQRDSYLDDSLKGKATIHKNILYLYYAGYGQLKITLSGGYGDDVAFYNIKFKITYPDTTNLYL